MAGYISSPCSEHKNKPLPFERAGALIVSGQNKIPAGVSRRERRLEARGIFDFFVVRVDILDSYENIIIDTTHVVPPYVCFD